MVRGYKVAEDKNKRGGVNMLRLPVRGLPSMRIVYEFPDLKGKVLGGGFKLYLRDLLKKVPEYHRVIELDFRVEGKSDEGVTIPVNTLGRWVFGVPGYAGNARFISLPEEVPVVEVWCGGCGADVIYAIDRLFAYAGGKRVE
jgi:hypothetical protein